MSSILVQGLNPETIRRLKERARRRARTVVFDDQIVQGHAGQVQRRPLPCGDARSRELLGGHLDAVTL
jgi:hypothetical protein